jgi:hypothetical protein
MTNESAKILLIFMLFGSIRIAISMSALAKSQPQFDYHALLERLAAWIWSAMTERATQRVALKRDRSNR